MAWLWSVWTEPEAVSEAGKSGAPEAVSEVGVSDAPAVAAEVGALDAPEAVTGDVVSGEPAVAAGVGALDAPEVETLAAPGGWIARWYCLANPPGSRPRAESAVPVPAPAAAPQEIELKNRSLDSLQTFAHRRRASAPVQWGLHPGYHLGCRAGRRHRRANCRQTASDDTLHRDDGEIRPLFSGSCRFSGKDQQRDGTPDEDAHQVCEQILQISVATRYQFLRRFVDEGKQHQNHHCPGQPARGGSAATAPTPEGESQETESDGMQHQITARQQQRLGKLTDSISR